MATALVPAASLHRGDLILYGDHPFTVQAKHNLGLSTTRVTVRTTGGETRFLDIHPCQEILITGHHENL